MTCHNRRDKTLNCLKSLFANYHNKVTQKTVIIECFLVDDGSTDRTAEEVASTYPQVNIIQGNGTLYWNQGMRLAWSTALDKKFDCYLWLNDDSILYSDALVRIFTAYRNLIKEHKYPGAIIGTLVNPISKKATYGGRLRNSLMNPLRFGEVITPSFKPVECHFINGNFTLIPATSVKKIGLLSSEFSHSMGDYDYGLRLQKEGLTCWVADGIYGECELNSTRGGCTDANTSIKDRIKKMKNLSQLPPVNEWKFFVRTHGGYLWPILWLKVWFREKFPIVWVLLRSKKT